jgi:hypothetical protein
MNAISKPVQFADDTGVSLNPVEYYEVIKRWVQSNEQVPG